MQDNVRVTVWGENVHERSNPRVRSIYPDGMHEAIARGISAQGGLTCRTVTLEMPEHGLTDTTLDDTDVLIWWGHKAHKEVKDEIVDRVRRHVLSGMGLIALHSAHYSKIFKTLMGTTCSLRWREAGERERIWNIAPNHPITAGIRECFEIPNAEMYGERFDIPSPDEIIFLSWFEGGEVFRSGCTWTRGHGKVFFFRPGHETYPIYYQEEVLRVIANACRWARPRARIADICPKVEPKEVLGRDRLEDVATVTGGKA
jgi:trehalose utilization protein